MGSTRSLSCHVNHPNDLSPTNFSSMELLDMEGFIGHDETSPTSGESVQKNSNNSVRNSTNSGDRGASDLMFMEAL